MTTEQYPTPTDTEPRITDILRRMVELAREASRDHSAPNSPGSPKSAKDSNRMAKIAMQMAMNSLESPSGQQNMLETMLLQRVAEEKERRRDRRWEDRVERTRRNVEQRMLDEREKEIEWQEVKLEALRRREEAERNAVELRAAEEVRRIKEEVLKAREAAEAARQEAARAKEEAARAKEEADRAKEEADQAKKEAEKAREEAKQAREEAERAKAETAHERQRADRAEAFQAHQAAKDEAERHTIEEQQEATAWSRYRRQWRLLKRVSLAINSAEIFRFEDIPWPTVIPPNSPAMITDAEVATFLFAGPPLREGETFRSRIKDCLLTWHPDKFSGRWIRYVVESDRARVTEGITAVTRAGNNALSDYTSRPNSELYEEGRVPRDKRVHVN